MADYLRDHKIKFTYEEHKFDYVVQGKNLIVCPNCGPLKAQIVRKYTPDFYIERSEVFLELKGRFVAKDRSKMIAVKKQHPKLDVRLVFMRDNLFGEGKNKMRYSEWATKHGFQWCIRDVPEEWFKKRDRGYISWREAMKEDN